MNRCSYCLSWIQLLIQPILCILVFLYIVIPTLIYMYPSISSKLVFMNIFTGNFTDFEGYNRTALETRNFYITSETCGIKLGFWQMLPQSDVPPTNIPSDKDFENMLSNGRPVVLYFHGNLHHRAGRYAIQMYRLLNKMNFHIVTLDYRGYGDSEGSPMTENEVVLDALTAYNYVKKKAPNSQLYIWGHSLGTGVTSSLVKYFSDLSLKLDIQGIILEAPFTNIKEAGWHHPYGKIFRWLPYFESIFLDGITRNNIFFNNSINLLKADVPILIIHSEDDYIVPYHLGEQLATELIAQKKMVTFQPFAKDMGYFHSQLFRAKNLPQVITDFMEKVDTFHKTRV